MRKRRGNSYRNARRRRGSKGSSISIMQRDKSCNIALKQTGERKSYLGGQFKKKIKISVIETRYFSIGEHKSKANKIWSQTDKNENLRKLNRDHGFKEG